jgi:purine-binding chemotaxis protein CheW
MAATNAAGQQLGQWVIFTLGPEEYAVKATQVQEIARLTVVTHVPGMPSFIRGVINLRGKIVPILDLKSRFRIAEGAANDTSTRIVIALIGEQLIGLIVDAVSGVVRLPTSQIEPIPATLPKVDADYLIGVGKVADKLVVLLNLDKMLTDFEKGLLREVKVEGV